MRITADPQTVDAFIMAKLAAQAFAFDAIKAWLQEQPRPSVFLILSCRSSEDPLRVSLPLSGHHWTVPAPAAWLLFVFLRSRMLALELGNCPEVVGAISYIPQEAQH